MSDAGYSTPKTRGHKGHVQNFTAAAAPLPTRSAKEKIYTERKCAKNATFPSLFSKLLPSSKKTQKNFEEAQLFATLVHILQQGAEGS